MNPTEPAPATDWPVLATWHSPSTAAQLAGHFPGHVLVPGARLLDEAIAQLESHTGLRVCGVREAKFPASAPPGAALALHVAALPTATTTSPTTSSPTQARFALLHAGQVVCTGVLSLAASA